VAVKQRQQSSGLYVVKTKDLQDTSSRKITAAEQQQQRKQCSGVLQMVASCSTEHDLSEEIGGKQAGTVSTKRKQKKKSMEDIRMYNGIEPKEQQLLLRYNNHQQAAAAAAPVLAGWWFISPTNYRGYSIRTRTQQTTRP
jgi:hypothetical protein